MALQYTTSASISVGTALNSLATGSSAQTAVVTTNITNNTVDAEVSIEINVGAITPAVDKIITVWVFGSEDGTNFVGNDSGDTYEVLGGGAGAVSLQSFGNNLKWLGTITPTEASKDVRSQPFNIAPAFGGVLPRKWGLVITNSTGVALAASGHSVSYSELYYT